MPTPGSAAAAALTRRMCIASAVLRAVALAWSAVVVAIDTDSGVLDRAGAAAAVLAVLAVWSAVWFAAAMRGATWVRGAAVGVDLVLAATAMAADHVVYDGAHPQSLASIWPLVAIMSAGVARGAAVGAVGGAAVGAVNIAAAAATGELVGNVLAASGSAVLLTAAGWVTGSVADRLRADTTAIAAAEAREEWTRTLHDGVLQTLAVIQRRSSDDELVALARTQEIDLRRSLRGDTGAAAVGTVAAQLTEQAASWSQRHGITVDVVVIDDPDVDTASSAALVAAAAEAVTNAAKHSGADHVTVSVDRGISGGVQVWVHDEGRGFDPASTVDGMGLTHSVRGRLGDVGGTATVRSAPGRGCEVALWVP